MCHVRHDDPPFTLLVGDRPLLLLIALGRPQEEISACWAGGRVFGALFIIYNPGTRCSVIFYINIDTWYFINETFSMYDVTCFIPCSFLPCPTELPNQTLRSLGPLTTAVPHKQVSSIFDNLTTSNLYCYGGP